MIKKVNLKLRRALKDLALSSRSMRRLLLPKYEMMFSPQQLFFICDMIDKCKGLSGDIVEVGCDRGCTTLFLNKFMDAQGIEKRYVCIDTFSGFTAEDIDFEGRRRSIETERNSFSVFFKGNSKKWFEQTMRDNGVDRVTAVRADICDYDFSEGASIAICLIDCDLYRPVKCAMEKVYPKLAKGGIMIVDDCETGGMYEGARQAYEEFVKRQGLEARYALGKLGVIEKGLSA